MYKILPFLRLADYDDYTRNNALKGLLHKTEIPPTEFQYNGYLSNTMDTIPEKYNLPERADAVISDGSMDLLKDIIQRCKKDSIKLVMVYLPEYRHKILNNTPNASNIIKVFEKFSLENNIELLRHDELALCNDGTLFANPGHLNTRGGKIYSIYLGGVVKTALK